MATKHPFLMPTSIAGRVMYWGSTRCRNLVGRFCAPFSRAAGRFVDRQVKEYQDKLEREWKKHQDELEHVRRKLVLWEEEFQRLHEQRRL